jgi:hypothetical protein
VLAGVEDEQQLAAPQVVHDRVRLGPGLLPGQPETGRDGVRQQIRIMQFAQLSQADAVGELAAGLSRSPQRDARLPDAARAGHGHQPGGAQQSVQHGQLPLAADEPSDLGGQLTRIASD